MTNESYSGNFANNKSGLLERENDIFTSQENHISLSEDALGLLPEKDIPMHH